MLRILKVTVSLFHITFCTFGYLTTILDNFVPTKSNVLAVKPRITVETLIWGKQKITRVAKSIISTLKNEKITRVALRWFYFDELLNEAGDFLTHVCVARKFSFATISASLPVNTNHICDSDSKRKHETTVQIF